MKSFYRLFNTVLSVSLFMSLSFAQVTYVDTDAAGAGDGTSWADAFIELQPALTAATAGEIWIAAGTYSPTSTELDTFNTFAVSNEISIYGGFGGTESTKEERVLNENTTVLSGDIMGNDIDNNFTTNKEDNVFHIMVIVATVPSTIILDGITFQGGQTRDVSEESDLSWRGGAIYSLNTLNVNNCNFNNNFARSGGAVYLSPEVGGGSGSTFNNCLFERNSCVTQAAGVFANTISDVTITNSTFQNNTTNRGVLYPIYCENFNVDACTFNNNITNNASNFGGAMFIWNSSGAVTNSTFSENNTGNGAAIHIDGREIVDPSSDNFIFDNCTFSGNSSSDFGGGAIRTATASFTVSNCDFLNNTSSNGGAIFSNGPGQEISIRNNNFEGNTADFGASHINYGLYSNYHISNNTYTGNAAFTSGGGLINGFGANVVIDSCDFTENLASFGGAISNQNDTTNVEIYNSNFIENSVTDGNGGAINISTTITVTIDNCLFESNSAGVGGAISGAQGNTVDVIEGFLNISNSIITLNTATSQGAGISLVDLDMEMTNTLVSTNFNTGTGAGGAMSLNTTANKTSTFNITNSTIADNFAIIGGGIGAFTEDETSNCIINLQNTIFSNEGLNYEVEGGSPATSSLGGNISTDATLNDILTNTGDINESGDLLFVNSPINDFQLMDNSPAINIGVAAGAPDTDILGNPRFGAPDAGAYENQDPLGIEVIENAGQLTMMPNPVHSNASITLSNSWNGQINISILDVSGKLMSTSTSQKANNILIHDVDLNQLNAGNYILTLASKTQKVSIPFIKI